MAQALTITFLCSILFGIVDCGRMMYAYHFVSSAARDASRWASVRSINSQLGALNTRDCSVPGATAGRNGSGSCPGLNQYQLFAAT